MLHDIIASIDRKKVTGEDFINNMCENNIKSKDPKKCKECGSIRMYFDPSAGPIVGGVGDWRHPPNAHPTGAWICMDCIKINSEKRLKEEEEQKIREAPQVIKQKKSQIKKLQKEIKELEKLMKT